MLPRSGTVESDVIELKAPSTVVHQPKPHRHPKRIKTRKSKFSFPFNDLMQNLPNAIQNLPGFMSNLISNHASWASQSRSFNDFNGIQSALKELEALEGTFKEEVEEGSDNSEETEEESKLEVSDSS